MARMSLNQEQAYKFSTRKKEPNWAYCCTDAEIIQIRTSYMSKPADARLNAISQLKR